MPDPGDAMTSARDLEREMTAAAEAMTFGQHERLVALGIDCLPYLTERYHIGIARVDIIEGDLFVYNPAGATHVLLPVADENSEIVDIVSFDPRQPGEWFLRTGNGQALGEDRITEAMSRMGYPDYEPLLLHPNPLSWLKGNCEGACVVDGYSDAICARIRALPSVRVTNHAFQLGLLQLLARRADIPNIQIKGKTL
jgi:hypothetical protein